MNKYVALYYAFKNFLILFQSTFCKHRLSNELVLLSYEALEYKDSKEDCGVLGGKLLPQEFIRKNSKHKVYVEGG